MLRAFGVLCEKYRVHLYRTFGGKLKESGLRKSSVAVAVSAFVACVCATSVAHAQQSPSSEASAPVVMQIVHPIGITSKHFFGSDVAVKSGALNMSGVQAGLPAVTGNHQAVTSFYIVGENGFAYTVVTPAKVTAHGSFGEQSIVATLDGPHAGIVGNGLTGAASFIVTSNIDPSIAEKLHGTYTAAFEETVLFN